MKFARMRRGLVASAISAFALAAPMAAPVSAQNLTMLVQPEPTTLLAQLNTSSSVQIVATKIFDGLFNLDADLELQPALALGYELSDDGRTLTLELRPDVRWHDGEPFTSEDVRYTLMEVIKEFHPRGRSILASLTAVETPDEHTAILQFAEPTLYALRSLTGPEAPILPAHIFAGSDVRENPAGNAPIGTGPFKFEEWDRGSAIILSANEDYWMPDAPKVERLIVRNIPDPSTRSIALETGEVAVAGMNPIALSELNAVSEVEGVEVSTAGYDALGGIMFFEFNTRLEKFADVRVRQAIAHALNRQFIADNVWFGLGTPATSPVPSWVAEFHNEALTGYDYDLEEATRLLDEAGLTPDEDGWRLSFTHDVMPFDENYQRLARYFKQALAQVGINVELRNQDFPTWLSRVYTDYDYETSAYIVFAGVDPAIGIQRLIWGDNIRSGVAFSNASGYDDDTVDGLLADAATAPTQEERIAIWNDVQSKVMEDLPVLPLIDVSYATIHQGNVSGIEDDGYGVFGSFANVSVDE
ncbi:ABC transporter substrate-binding protein [Psychromarinibacter halotolerans]|uniref:ABC transporter substrate-binding protein n=1 Tax=Psychromarinibacter halotolerans TaxID=1775175 RepID=A0ABV7GWY5_9RHOB|nr:ABC transporter substrate-binding protein [Psychromarinibacter halotolerans]MDF0597613.1 ABC transporter substrate-binding protein [Psychromarinibacter halotolerans]